MSTNNSNKLLRIGLIITLALLVGIAFYTINLYKTSNDTEKSLVEQKQLVIDDLSKMAKQYDDVIGQNKVANSNLVDARNRINGLIDSLKVTEANVKNLYLYKQKYNDLQNEMQKLLTKNQQLELQNRGLATSLDSANVKLVERTQFNDSLVKQNVKLADVVTKASVLTAVDVRGTGVILRNSGKVIPTEKARRSDKIRVCFIVAKNDLVKSGDHEMFIQVTDPQKNILGINNQIESGGETINYSVISKFYYENANLNVCEFITPNSDGKFLDGTYEIKVYFEGKLVSTSSFVLN